MKKIVIAVGLMMTLLLSLGWSTPSHALTDIPNLPQVQRSDWLNVKTQTPAAKGDGIADDTAAIQAAIDKLGNLGPDESHVSANRKYTIYLPAGTYKITQPLRISDIGRAYQSMMGVQLVGDGALTRLVWGGAAEREKAMIVSNGASEARYEGMILDGANLVGVGLDHASTRTFETEVDHLSLSFRNFTNAGIRVGSTNIASAEMLFKNCVFTDCSTGIQILASNDLDNVVTGCEFRRCSRGIVIGYLSNAYIRDSHFEGSTAVDIIAYGPIHPCSVRRCTSVGSKRFIVWSSSVATLQVQDCRVDKWTATAANTPAPDFPGAIVLQPNTQPTVIFDCAFTNPPDASPPIYNAANALTISNNTSAGSPQLVGGPGKAPIIVPPGAKGASLTSASQNFLTTPVLPKKVFDAKVDFGAHGDGALEHDDTKAVQATINAAKKAGNGTIAYLPSGHYNISSTLDMSGSNYVVGGGASGWHTELVWRGPAGNSPILHIHDVNNVRLENIAVGTSAGAGVQTNGVDIFQDGKTAGSMTYDGVRVYGRYSHTPTVKGLRIEGLPAGSKVHLTKISGNTNFIDCSRAKILIDVSWDGAMTVGGGKELVRDGFLGCLTRLSTTNIYGLYVTDNQNLVMTDYYSESADAYWSISGLDGQPAGRVTIAGIKVHTKNLDNQPTIKVDNYQGQVSAFGLQLFSAPDWNVNPYSIEHTGDRPLDLVLAGNTATDIASGLKVTLSPSGTLTPIGNFWVKPADNITPEGLAKVALALDDFRTLGALDLQMNYPTPKASTAKVVKKPAFKKSAPKKQPAKKPVTRKTATR